MGWMWQVELEESGLQTPHLRPTCYTVYTHDSAQISQSPPNTRTSRLSAQGSSLSPPSQARVCNYLCFVLEVDGSVL
jgi:hypothetical protein